MPFEFLELERDGNIAIVSLNRPDKRNALSIALRYELDRALGELEEEDAILVVIVLGNGPVFCAGFDIGEFADRSPEHVEKLSDSSNRHHKRLAEFSKPLIAGIHGPAMGGGFDIAVLCDVRIASTAAVFAHPEIKFGANVLFGPLKEIIGGGLARDLALTGRKIDANEAYRIGLVSEVVAPGDLKETCLKTARTIAEAPMGSLKAVKRQIVDSYGGWRQGGPMEDLFGDSPAG